MRKRGRYREATDDQPVELRGERPVLLGATRPLGSQEQEEGTGDDGTSNARDLTERHKDASSKVAHEDAFLKGNMLDPSRCMHAHQEDSEAELLEADAGVVATGGVPALGDFLGGALLVPHEPVVLPEQHDTKC